MSNLVFEKLTQSLAAGEVWRLGIAADFFRIAAAAYAVEVRILKAGRIIGDMDGWQAGDYVRGVDFDSVEIVNGAVSQVVTVQIAGGGVGSDRVVGEVSVISGELSRTRAGITFYGGYYKNGAAGQIPFVTLSNQVGSGKRLVVEGVAAGVSDMSGFSVRWTAGEIGTFVSSPQSKMIGAGASVARVTIGEAATYQGTEIAGTMTTANVTQALLMQEPIIIPPGYSVIVHSGAVANTIRATFSFFEESL